MGCMGIFRLSSETFDERCRLGAESFRFDLQLFAGEKTEDPTAKRQSDARAEGNIPRSQELSSTFVLLAGFWSLKVFGGYIYNEITVYFTYIYNHLNTTVDTETVMRLFLSIIILFWIEREFISGWNKFHYKAFGIEVQLAKSDKWIRKDFFKKVTGRVIEIHFEDYYNWLFHIFVSKRSNTSDAQAAILGHKCQPAAYFRYYFDTRIQGHRSHFCIIGF